MKLLAWSVYQIVPSFATAGSWGKLPGRGITYSTIVGAASGRRGQTGGAGRGDESEDAHRGLLQDSPTEDDGGGPPVSGTTRGERRARPARARRSPRSPASVQLG